MKAYLYIGDEKIIVEKLINMEFHNWGDGEL